MIYAWSEAWISPKIFVFDTMQATSQAAGTQQKLTSIVCVLHSVCVCVLCVCVKLNAHKVNKKNQTTLVESAAGCSLL